MPPYPAAPKKEGIIADIAEARGERCIRPE